MKTFKLVALTLLHGQKQDISLIDGLMINKEDENKRWLIEAYVEQTYRELFTSLKESEAPFDALVTISRKTNDPAHVRATVRSVTMMGERMSVLMDAVIIQRSNLAEVVLEDLVQRGLHGETLLQQFKQQMHTKRG
ncbi:YwpF-like family protein [Anoxybacillus suryakundensis]|uniref:YwpF-like protein n=1 Tax=Anoxybacillus suryakundensis TaxID=1325335 RepID=A0A0K6GPX7_9BACL|nr:YwpF-like family protein [Anoxybacillus suryakundensis]CUA80789.1 YwpF-like protein [Anoxybacillus suryakundensis]